MIIIITALLPAVLLWYNIYRKDQNPEPKKMLLKAAFYGMLICLPVVVVQEIMTEIFLDSESETKTLFDSIIDAFFVAAIPEECFKLLALTFVVRKSPTFNEHFDGIVYAVCVGMGFAGLENILYLLDETDWMEGAILRAFMSVPGHYADAVLMGYYYSVYHFINRSFSNKVMILLAPIMAHGTYDALLMMGEVDEVLAVISFILCIGFCYILQKIASKKIKKLLDGASNS